MNFKDHFSAHSEAYRQSRPSYPPELFTFLSSLVECHNRAWDCATGNGQAAVALAQHFKEVIATDASAEQIRCAYPANHVTYRVATAENSGLETESIDLITVAQALHWFDQESFFKEVSRVLKPKGVFAAWCYRLFRVEGLHENALNHLIHEFYEEVVGSYWPPERIHIDSEYATLPIPFNPIQTPSFWIEPKLTVHGLCDYLSTWSAVRYYIAKNNDNPVITWFLPRLLKFFPSDESLIPLNIPITLIATRRT